MKIYFNLFKSILFSFLSTSVSYFTVIYISRIYNPNSVSHYLQAITWGSLLVLIFDFGIEQSLVHYAKSNNYSIFKLWKKIFKIKLIFILLVFTSFFIFEYFTNYDLPLYIFLLVFPVFNFAPIFEYYKLNKNYSRVLFLERLFYLLTVLFFSYLQFDIIFLIYSYAFASLISLVLQYVSIDKNVSSQIGTKENCTLSGLLNYFPVYLVLISQLFYGNVSRLIIDAKFGDLSFAYVTLAFQIINSISFIQTQVDRFIRPEVIDAFERFDQKKIFDILKKYIGLYILPLVILSLLLAFFSNQVISVIYGNKWYYVGTVLRYSTPLFITISCMRFIDIMVIPLNATKINLAINLFSGFFSFLLLYLNDSKDLLDYIIIIALCQAFHVFLMMVVLFRKINFVFK